MSAQQSRVPRGSATYQAHEGIAVILLLFASTIVSLRLGAELLAHPSVVIHSYRRRTGVLVRR